MVVRKAAVSGQSSAQKRQEASISRQFPHARICLWERDTGGHTMSRAGVGRPECLHHYHLDRKNERYPMVKTAQVREAPSETRNVSKCVYNYRHSVSEHSYRNI